MAGRELIFAGVVGGFFVCSIVLAGPAPVSPGGVGGGLVQLACPTFSWSAPESGGPIELLVYPVTAQMELASEPALATRLPAGARSWTPSADRCLRAGSRYAWTVREGETGEWAEPSIFEITRPGRTEVTEALETLKRYLDGGVEDEIPSTDEPSSGAGFVAVPRTSPPTREMAPELASTRSRSRLDPAVNRLEMREPGAAIEESHGPSPAAVHAVEPSTTGLSHGVWAESRSNQGRGVYGLASATQGNNYGVWGRSISTQGRGVLGQVTATNGPTYGVYGTSWSTGGRGVFGYATATQGTTYGVYGRTNSGDGVGVAGFSQVTTGHTYGVYGESISTRGRGVFGFAFPNTGITFGVSGVSNSSAGYGVSGHNPATTGSTIGVAGTSGSTQGYGVYGHAYATSGTAYGIYGNAQSPQGYAGFFSGNVHITGTLSKSNGSFKIDHPLDPANQYLSHAFVESPDMMNVYNGNAVLGDDGTVWVELPEWFDALNRDFRYQLTPLDRPAPGLFVAERIAGNRFRIAGGEPGVEVSWLVTGIRQDALAKIDPIVVEEDKGELRGRYLNPEAHGQPRDLAIGYFEPPRSEMAGEVEAPVQESAPSEATRSSPAAANEE